MTSYHNGRVTVWQGDCRDVLAGFEADSFDSACVDPPYHFASIVKRFQNGEPSHTKTAHDVKNRSTPMARHARGFMGQKWDGGQLAHEPETWAAVLRVLKPGAHLVAFHAPKNWHRLALAIEDAGFEIRDTCLDLYSLSDAAQRFIGSLSLSQRDMLGRLIDGCDPLGALFWNFGSGFPKSHNPKTGASCSCTNSKALSDLPANLDSENAASIRQEQDLLSEMSGRANLNTKDGQDYCGTDSMREMRQASVSRTVSSQEKREGLLQPVMPSKIGDSTDSDSTLSQGTERMDGGEPSFISNEDERGKESRLEGRCDVSEPPRELCFSQVRSMPAGSDQHGSQGRICDGTSISDGALGREAASEEGNGSSLGPLSAQQSAQQSGTLAGQSEPQTSGAWPLCERCGKPIIPDGLGSALKPAYEPIVLARKPLARGKTIAGNVLAWGTGALNIDACRVVTCAESFADSRSVKHNDVYGKFNPADYDGSKGRWPANILLDGSKEVVEGFPESDGQIGGSNDPNGSMGYHGGAHGISLPGVKDSGSAARFFYTAKADADDRLGSRHPTVKPLDLIQWLCRLITPPKGHILDCFAGTGTLAEAALREGFQCTLIEREAEYLADIDRRMALAFEGSTGRSVAMAKLKPEGEPLPLFAEAAE